MYHVVASEEAKETQPLVMQPALDTSAIVK
jgi:hypothetical protein